MVYWTQEFEDITADIPAFIAQMLALINLGYTNSKVPLEVYLFCADKAVGLSEVTNSKTMLNNFVLWKGSYTIFLF